MKKFNLKTKYRQHFPIGFDFISYWKLGDEIERIDNFDDPFFDGITSEKYQTSSYIPSSHFKSISKILDLTHFDKKEPI